MENELDASGIPLVVTDNRTEGRPGMGVRARHLADELLASGARVVRATGRYIGEGFDDPRLDTLMFAMPVA